MYHMPMAFVLYQDFKMVLLCSFNISGVMQIHIMNNFVSKNYAIGFKPMVFLLPKKPKIF